jgi:hypothetical protein
VALTAGRASSLSNPSEDATTPRGVGLERKSLCLTSIGMGGFSIGGRSADSSADSRFYIAGVSDTVGFAGASATRPDLAESLFQCRHFCG